MAATYNFPLEDQEHYKGRIVFGILQENPVNLVTDQLEQLLSYNPSNSSTEENQEGQANDLLTAINVDSLKNGPLDTRPNYSASRGTVVKSCALYLPQSLQITDGALYENINLGQAGAVGEAAIKGGMSATGAIGTVISDQITSFVDAFKGPHASDLAKVATVNVAQKFFGETAGAAVSSALRITPNPNVRALFKGVPLREFSFSFKLQPRSQIEAKEIKKIIYFFRSELYPEEIAGPEILGQAVSFGYRFPNKFDIKIYYDGEDIATKILPCYLRTFTATYNGGSMGMFYDGNFTEVDINMSFMETKTLNKSMISKGY